MAKRSTEERANEAFTRVSAMPLSYFEKARTLYGETDDSALRVFLAVRTVARRIDNVVGAWLDRHGLTVTKFDLLHLIEAEEPAGATIGTLRDFLSMTQPNVTFVVQSLEREGLATRHQDPADRRATIVHITPAGEELLKTITPGYCRAIAEAIHDMTDTRRTLIVESLADLAEGFEAVDRPEPG